MKPSRQLNPCLSAAFCSVVDKVVSFEMSLSKTSVTNTICLFNDFTGARRQHKFVHPLIALSRVGEPNTFLPLLLRSIKSKISSSLLKLGDVLWYTVGTQTSVQICVNVQCLCKEFIYTNLSQMCNSLSLAVAKQPTAQPTRFMGCHFWLPFLFGLLNGDKTYETSFKF